MINMDEKTKNSIFELRKNGLSCSKIAKMLGIDYQQVYFNSLTLEQKKMRSLSQRIRYNFDDEYREKTREQSRKNVRKYQKRRSTEDPNWNAERQREFRRKHPIGFNKVMARFYLRRLPRNEVIKVLEDIGYYKKRKRYNEIKI